MTDTPKDETVVVDDSKTQVTPTAEPVVVNAADTAVEELKKQLAQQEMRANQLANQLKAKEEADAAAAAKEMEEQNQFKELFEQEKAKREALEQEQETKEKQAELDRAKAETLKEFSEDVKSQAEKLGITLLDTDDKSVEAFKEKLAVLGASQSSSAKITANNPNQTDSKIELTNEQIREAMYSDKTGDVFHDLVTKKFPGIASMTKAGK